MGRLAVIVATAILIGFAFDGHWFGGQPYDISFTVPADAEVPRADLVWKIVVANTVLASGAIEVMRGHTHQLTIELPPVRVRTTATWLYEFTQVTSDDFIEHGQHYLHLYPTDLLDSIAIPTDRRLVMVADASDSLVGVLNESGIPFERINEPTQMPLYRVDMVIVVANHDKPDGFAQTALLRIAGAGSTVLVLERIGTRGLFDLPFRRTRFLSGSVGEKQCPLLTHIEQITPDMLLHLKAGTDRSQEPTFYHSQPNTEADMEADACLAEDDPLFALLSAYTIGRGELILAQIPFREWRSDPRSQLLLRNAILHLSGGHPKHRKSIGG